MDDKRLHRKMKYDERPIRMMIYDDEENKIGRSVD